MMGQGTRTVSLVAERAVRYLRERKGPVDSVRLAREVLSTTAGDEATATRVLRAAFAGDPRLEYERGAWTRVPGASVHRDPDRVLIVLRGDRPARGAPFRIHELTVLRVRDGEVLVACGGSPSDARQASELRDAVLSALEGAVPVVHDPPGSLAAFESWLGAPLGPAVSLRKLGQIRCKLPSGHSLERLAGALGVSWLDSEDPLDVAAAMDSCLDTLRRDGESLDDLLTASGDEAAYVDWSRFAFDREFLLSIPRTPGTYRFFDEEGRLLYVGKSRDLHARVGSYFRAGSADERVRRLVRALHRIEVDPTGSELEAVLREAEQIRRDDPTGNVQRAIHPRASSKDRLSSIMILEPAAPPWVLRAYLLRDGRLVDRVGIGPRGGGLRKIERILRDRFFFAADGPTTAQGPDVDVETVARWLAAHRDRVVAFDPTDLPGPREVTDRLRAFLADGSPFDPDFGPIHRR